MVRGDVSYLAPGDQHGLIADAPSHLSLVVVDISGPHRLDDRDGTRRSTDRPGPARQRLTIHPERALSGWSTGGDVTVRIANAADDPSDFAELRTFGDIRCASYSPGRRLPAPRHRHWTDTRSPRRF